MLQLPKGDGGMISLRADGETAISEATLESLRVVLNNYLIEQEGIFFEVLLELSGDAAIAKRQAADNTIVRFAGHSTVVWASKLTTKVVRELIVSGEIRRGRLLRFNIENAGTIGLFSYQQGPTNPKYATQPYYRRQIPKQPLKLQDFPTALQAAIARTRFDRLRFADADTVWSPG